MKSKSEVWITTEFVGFHRWPEAPDEVSYLRQMHRHNFKIKVTIPITVDRGIEFHLLKLSIDSYLVDLLADPTDDSCEHLATKLSYYLLDRWRTAYIISEVSEDGECGATVRVEREEL